MKSEKAYKILLFLVKLSIFLMALLVALMFVNGLLGKGVNGFLVVLLSVTATANFFLYKALASKERWSWFFLLILTVFSLFYTFLLYFQKVFKSPWMLAASSFSSLLYLVLLALTSEIFLSSPKKNISELLSDNSFVVCVGWYLLLVAAAIAL